MVRGLYSIPVNVATANVTVKLDLTPPEITATVDPAPNAAGWHTNDVTVTFQATDGLSGLASLTSPVVLTNEVIDELVEGIAVDEAGNAASAIVLISIDKGAPTVTGSPGDGDTVNSRRPPFVVEYSDEGSGTDQLSLNVILDGTNVTANFESFAAGAIWIPTNDLSAGAHTWEITVADEAGNSAYASATFTLEDPATSGGPSLSAFNITDGMIMPDVEAVWVQGVRSDTNVVASFSVNFGAPQAFNARWDQFGMLVPLEFGTNIVVITAADTNSMLSTKAFRVIRSDRYRAALNLPANPGDFAMSSPAMGYFANGELQSVSGYVSAKRDEGTVTEADVSSVSVNGVPCNLGSVDGNCNIGFDTGTNTVSVSTNFTSGTVTICWDDDSCETIPLAVWEGYQFVEKHSDNRYAVYWADLSQNHYLCPGFWFFNPQLTYENVDTFHYEEPGSIDSLSITTGHDGLQGTTAEQACTDNPTNPPSAFFDLTITNGFSSGFEPGLTDLSLTFGRYSREEIHDFTAFQYPWGPGDRVQGTVVDFSPGEENYLTFRTPVYYGDGATVILTLTDVSYEEEPGVEMNLSNVVFQLPGATVDPDFRVIEGNNIGFLVQYGEAGQTYTINEDCFTWPSWSRSSLSTNAYENITSTTNAHWLTFSGFKNNGCDSTFVSPHAATKVYVNQSQEIEIVAKVTGAADGTVVEWRFEDPEVDLMTDAPKVGSDTQAGEGNDNNGDKDQNNNWLVGFVQGGGGVVQEATSATQAGLAKIKFRTSSFAGDNYKIKAWVQECGETLWKTSETIAVWRKFTVEVDAMENPSGGEFYPFQTGVATAFKEIFIDLEFKDNQTAGNQLNTRYVPEITDGSCDIDSDNERAVSGYVRTGSQNNGTTYATGRDLHVIGIRKFANALSRRGSTCGRHSLVECAGRANGQISFTTAHELGHGLGYSGHPDQNAQDPGIMGTLGNVSITQVPHFNANQAEFFRDQATPQYSLPE